MIKELDNAISITSKNGQYLIKHLYTCSCVEFNNLLLPCKHIFFCRTLKNEKTFVKDLIPNRWKKSKEDNFQINLKDNRNEDIFFTDLHSINSMTKKSFSIDNDEITEDFPNFSTVFRFAQNLTKSVISYNSKAQERLLALEFISRMWADNKDLKIIPLHDNLHLDNQDHFDISKSIVEFPINQPSVSDSSPSSEVLIGQTNDELSHDTTSSNNFLESLAENDDFCFKYQILNLS